MDKKKAKKIRAALRKAGYSEDKEQPGIWEHNRNHENGNKFSYMGTMMQCLNHAVRKGLISGEET